MYVEWYSLVNADHYKQNGQNVGLQELWTIQERMRYVKK